MICVIIMTLLTLSACSHGKRYYDDINIGMTYEEVVEIIGREPDSLWDDNAERTRYCWDTGGNERFIISFQKSKTDGADINSMRVINVALYK